MYQETIKSLNEMIKYHQNANLGEFNMSDSEKIIRSLEAAKQILIGTKLFIKNEISYDEFEEIVEKLEE